MAALKFKHNKAIDTMSSSITVATSEETEQRYVLKIGKPDEQHTFAEYDTLRALDHPCIPQAHAFFTIAGRHGILMQCVEGTTLDKSLPAKGSAQALGFARQLLGAVAYAHESAIIHRDISHDNIVFDGQKLWLIDWNYSRSGTPRRWPDTGGREGIFVRPELAKRLKLADKAWNPLILVGDVFEAVLPVDSSDGENGPGTSSTAGEQEKFEGETASTVAATTASGNCDSAPTSPLGEPSFDLYGKTAYRASPGQEGNLYQQDAYACGVILRDLQGGDNILETVANGLLAPPASRLSVSDALDLLTCEI
jgi:serine/threonine protein kinase